MNRNRPKRRKLFQINYKTEGGYTLGYAQVWANTAMEAIEAAAITPEVVQSVHCIREESYDRE